MRVIALVPGVNALRHELSPAGPVNIPQAETIKTEDGFKESIRDGHAPARASRVLTSAVLITTGLHDLRTPPWEPATLAAALQASGTARRILLRVDARAGHGIENTKSQNDAFCGDM